MDKTTKIEGNFLQFELTGFDFRDVENVVEESEKGIRRGLRYSQGKSLPSDFRPSQSKTRAFPSAACAAASRTQAAVDRPSDWRGQSQWIQAQQRLARVAVKGLGVGVEIRELPGVEIQQQNGFGRRFEQSPKA